jgi:uncharacterized protein (TIGR03067 family)
MRTMLLITALAVAVPDRPDPRPSDIKPLQERMLGEWLQVKRVLGGNEQPNDGLGLAITRETIQHIHHVNGMKDAGHSFSYTIDTAKNPAVITFRDSGYIGILKVEGDLLTFCYCSQGQPPADFVSPPNSPNTLVQATRIRK